MKTFNEYWDGLLFGKDESEKCTAEQVWFAARRDAQDEIDKLKAALKSMVQSKELSAPETWFSKRARKVLQELSND